MASKFLSDEKVNVLPWPSMSPDLNPIEHLWKLLKINVEENKPPNIAKLKKGIQDEWTSISSGTCAHLVDSMPRKLDAVISSKGSHTKYLEKVTFFKGLHTFVTCLMYCFVCIFQSFQVRVL